MADAPTVNDFMARLLTITNATLNRAVEGLADDQMRHRPADDANSIAWLVWHYSRWADRMTAIATGEAEVWTSDGWAAQFGVSATANGQGDTPEEVAAFRPAKDLVMGYAQAAHDACLRRVVALTPDDLLGTFSYGGNSPRRPLWQSLANTAMDFTQHIGQITYIRGLLSGYGWREEGR